MKKRAIIKLFIFLIVFSFIIQINAEVIEKNIDAIKNPNKITQDIKNTTQGIKINLANSAKIPDQIAFLPKLLFNINEEINFSELIIYSAILFLIFLIINQIIPMLELFEGWINTLVSVIITLIAGISGGITKGSEIWILLLSKISFFDEIGSWTISFMIIGLLIIYVLLKKFLTSMKESAKITKATYDGIRAGTGVAIQKIQADIISSKRN